MHMCIPSMYIVSYIRTATPYQSYLHTATPGSKTKAVHVDMVWEGGVWGYIVTFGKILQERGWCPFVLEYCKGKSWSISTIWSKSRLQQSFKSFVININAYMYSIHLNLWRQQLEGFSKQLLLYVCGEAPDNAWIHYCTNQGCSACAGHSLGTLMACLSLLLWCTLSVTALYRENQTMLNTVQKYYQEVPVSIWCHTTWIFTYITWSSLGRINTWP